MPLSFDLQGHRGARGQRPENTLPSFEAAFDSGVTTVETDLHLTRDGIIVLSHDPFLTDRLCRAIPGRSPDPGGPMLISGMTLAQVRDYRADKNPDPEGFPAQDAGVTPLARLFAERHGIDPFMMPTLSDLFAFAAAYAGDLGAAAGKTEAQRASARSVQFDLELKRVPYHPEFIGDGFDGSAPALLEERLVDAALRAGVGERTIVGSFDHRCVRVVRRLLSSLRTAVLVAGVAPLDPAQWSRAAEATTYCPEFEFLDEAQVRQLHEAGVRVVPWTVNEPADLVRLFDWGVDGVTTDYPACLAQVLRSRGVAFQASGAA